MTSMADYGCFTWTSAELVTFRTGPQGPSDLGRLGAPADLVQRLADWHAEWERGAYGDPPAPADDDPSWESRGWASARELQLALPDIDIGVQDGAASAVVAVPEAWCTGTTPGRGMRGQSATAVASPDGPDPARPSGTPHGTVRRH